MSNAGIQGKGKRKGSKLYRERGHRERNKAKRIERDAKRANPLPCGHGSRHKSPYDRACRVCFREGVGQAV